MPLHICYQQLYYKLSIFFLRFLTFGRLDSSLTYSSSYNYDFVWDEPDSFSKLASHHPATFIMVRKIIWCFKYVILYITSLYLAIISHCFLMQCSCEMISHFTSISFDFWKLPNLWHFFSLKILFLMWLLGRSSGVQRKEWNAFWSGSELKVLQRSQKVWRSGGHGKAMWYFLEGRSGREGWRQIPSLLEWKEYVF